MKVKNKEILKQLTEEKVCQTETVYNANLNEPDVVTNSNGDAVRVLVDTTSSDEIITAIMLKQLQTLKSIKSMLKFFTILTIISLAFSLLSFLI